jgi:hypothetical protein
MATGTSAVLVLLDARYGKVEGYVADSATGQGLPAGVVAKDTADTPGTQATGRATPEGLIEAKVTIWAKVWVGGWPTEETFVVVVTIDPGETTP